MKMFLVIIDFGLVVLVWLVQLVIYPSFKFYQQDDLVRWHFRYTTAISYVVMPLMLAQLFLYIHSLWVDFSMGTTLNFCLVLIIWGVTFLYAVPLHNNLSNRKDLQKSVDQLIKVNWVRTVLWSLIFILSLLAYHNQI